MPNSERTKFRVSCKAAIFSEDTRSVLVVKYPGYDHFGLPGGHMEAAEQPDVALARELAEELGPCDIKLQRSDFWLGSHDRVILGYTGYCNMNVEFNLPPDSEVAKVVWVSIDDIESGAVNIPTYRSFILSSRRKAMDRVFAIA